MNKQIIMKKFDSIIDGKMIELENLRAKAQDENWACKNFSNDIAKSLAIGFRRNFSHQKRGEYIFRNTKIISKLIKKSLFGKGLLKSSCVNTNDDGSICSVWIDCY